MSNSLYDLYLGDAGSIQGYRCRSLQRDSAPLVANRFATGAQGQTDLDLLKSASVDNLAGGMFQRQTKDPQKVARVIGMFNKYDENVYPTPPRSAALSPAPFGNILAKAENSQYIFASFCYVSGGIATNYLYKAAAGATVFTQITLPAALASGVQATTGNITGLCIHRDSLFINVQHPNGEQNNYRMNILTGAFQDIGGRSTLSVPLRGVLHTITNASAIYAATNEFAAGPATYTLIDQAGAATIPNDMLEYNGALWIAKPDGIFRFDGVRSVKVLSLVTTKMQVFNGAIYFASSNWLYRFDGSNVVRLQYFPETFGGFTASSDYLFIATYALLSTYLTSDKSGSGYPATDSMRRIYTYDGAAFGLMDERQATNVSAQYSNIYYTGSTLFDYNVNNGTISNYVYDLSTLFSAAAVTTSSKLDVTTSEFDDGFPNIYKSLEIIEANYSGLGAGDSIAVTYQYHDGKVWSAWTSAGTITSSTTNQLEITDSTKKLFKRLKINLVLSPAAGSAAALHGVSWRYTLQPRMRWRWQINLLAYGTPDLLTLNNTDPGLNANAVSNNILKAIKQKTPLFMLAPDYGIVKTGITSAALVFIVKGQPPIYTDPYNEYPYVSVMNSSGVWEVLRVASAVYSSINNETTVTVLERGYYGISPAAINANAEFHIAYKVYVTRLLRDAPVLDTTTYNEQPSGESQLKREYLLEITET